MYTPQRQSQRDERAKEQAVIMLTLEVFIIIGMLAAGLFFFNVWEVLTYK